MTKANDFGYRLRLARKQIGLSLRDLSSAINKLVSTQSLSKYERGEAFPETEVIKALTKALEVSESFLLSPRKFALGNIDFRRHSRTLASEKAKVEAEVLKAVEHRLELDEILGIRPQRGLEPEKISNVKDGDAWAAKIRKKWHLGQDPIPNMTALLEQYGYTVIMLRLPVKVSGLTCFVQQDSKCKVPVIVVNEAISLERRRFTLAHELAHRVFIIEDDDKATEKAANRFAGAFLMPESHVTNSVGKKRRAISLGEILLLKKVYGVSAAAFLYRLHQLDLVGQNQMEYAFKTFARSWRKTEPEPLEPVKRRGNLERPKAFDKKCLQALAEGLITERKASELLGRKVISETIGFKTVR